jgi:hypothetical protein
LDAIQPIATILDITSMNSSVLRTSGWCHDQSAMRSAPFAFGSEILSSLARFPVDYVATSAVDHLAPDRHRGRDSLHWMTLRPTRDTRRSGEFEASPYAAGGRLRCGSTRRRCGSIALIKMP